jgi:hypothetical protein
VSDATVNKKIHPAPRYAYEPTKAILPNTPKEDSPRWDQRSSELTANSLKVRTVGEVSRLRVGFLKPDFLTYCP